MREMQRNAILTALISFKHNFGFLHPVACVRSGNVGFYPSRQRQYRRLIYYLYYIATCLGHTTIIRKKILIARISQLTTDPLFYNIASIIVIILYIQLC
jgi:hypothetical protein